jgi:hypothetical protein
MAGGNVAAGAGSIAEALRQDVFSVPPGPITQALARFAAVSTSELVSEVAERIAVQLAPGVGQLVAALEVAETVNDVSQIGVAITDLANTPGVLYFQVRWPLDITRVEPLSIRPGQGETIVRIFGEGFAPITNEDGETSLPVVTFTDDTNSMLNVPIPIWSINADGTEMAAVLEDSYVQSLSGVALDVTVTHGGAVETLDNAISIADLIRIDSLTPSTGAGGSFVAISGAGFSADRAANVVTFAGEGVERLEATVVEATPSYLVVIAPAGVVTGPVTVEVGEELSNEVIFMISGELVSIRIGDTGTTLDDTFGLYVDGQHIHSMLLPVYVVGPFRLALAEGLHEVVLRGITAPDAIGTYTIELTGHVANVQGDALYGDDLYAGVEKRWTITVGPPPPSPAPLRVIGGSSAAPTAPVFGPPPGIVLGE